MASIHGSRDRDSMSSAQDDAISVTSSHSDSSPIKIHHDYDFQHNLNTSQTSFHSTSPSHLGSTSVLPQSNALGIVPQANLSFLSVDPAAGQRNPFNFTPQTYDAGGVGGQQQPGELGKRKGHRYRHSSIHAAHQIFLPPTQKAPLAVPASLPVPTRSEAWLSLSRSQNLRLLWCLCHFITAGMIQFVASGSLALTALSRLMFFDAAGAISCVAVDVMSNFEVWGRSTIRHPFGLGRADVLAGFGMAVFIGFMGLDIVSHGIQHALENLGNHEAHSSHSHARPSTLIVLLASLGAGSATLISAVVVGNHSRIGRTIQVPWLARWGSTFGNPSHLLTLSCCVGLLILPPLDDHVFHFADPVFAFLIAILMIAFGTKLGTRLGNILLMAYTDPTDKHAVSHLVSAIEEDSAVSGVEEAKIWQVHYGLGLADLKIRYRGLTSHKEISELRKRITSLIRSSLSPYDKGKGPRWDISIQVMPDKD